MAHAKPGERYTWKEGDIVMLKPGDGKPFLSDAEIDRILAENPEDADADAREAYRRKFVTEPPEDADVEQMIKAVETGYELGGEGHEDVDYSEDGR
jgi:hypothetical protein